MKIEQTVAALLIGCVTCLTTIGCGDGGPGGETPQMTVGIEEAFPGLSFARPVFLTAAPDGTDWIYVVEQDGTIRVFRNDDTLTSHNLFLDIVGRVQGPDDPGGGFEEGLLPARGSRHATFRGARSAPATRRPSTSPMRRRHRPQRRRSSSRSTSPRGTTTPA